MVPFGARMTRLPVFSSTAAVGVELVAAGTPVVVQRTGPPSPSDRTRLELLVRESTGVVMFVIGVSRLATHTTVSSGMLLYHMPRYSLAGVPEELEGLKKPNAKEPSSETMVAPGESGLPGTSRSCDAHNGRNRRIIAAVQQVTASQSMID
jgi:hypothetical protein